MNERIKASLGSLKQAVLTTVVLLVICGFLFPLLLTGLSKLFFPRQAGGSLIEVNGVAVGAQNVGQDFTDPRFLKCRPSSVNYNTYTEEQKANGEFSLGSGSNNYGPSNPALVERVEADIQEFLAANPGVTREQIPTDLVTASGSGLDPHISPASAEIQLPAVSAASGLSEQQLREIVAAHTEGKLFGIFGEERVNVLAVNLDIAKALGLLG